MVVSRHASALLPAFIPFCLLYINIVAKTRRDSPSLHFSNQNLIPFFIFYNEALLVVVIGLLVALKSHSPLGMVSLYHA